MKSIFISTLALAVMAGSCSKDKEASVPAGTVPTSGAYMSITIDAPKTTSTYANPGQNPGSKEESAVSEAYAVTFDTGRQKLDVVSLKLDSEIGLNGDKVPNNTGGSAFKVSSNSSYLLMVLNPSKNLKLAMTAAATYSDFQTAVYEDQQGDAAISTDGRFTMINQGTLSKTGADYNDEGLVDCSAFVVPTTDAKDADAAKAEAQAKPVEITVVRLAARVNLTNSMGAFTGTLKDDAVGAACEFVGWQMNTTNRSYLPYAPLMAYKDDKGNDIAELATAYRRDGNFTGVEPATEFNWLKNGNNTPSVATQITWRTNNTAAYVMENTMSAAGQQQINTTKITLKAKYTPAGMTAGSTWFAYSADGTNLENMSVADAETKAGADTDLAALLTNIAKKLGFADQAALFTALKADAGTDAKLDNIGYAAAQFQVDATKAFVRIYRNSDCYYDLLVKHNSNLDGFQMLGKWGVVRNNSYSLNVNSIRRAGLPYIPDPTDPDIVDPANPDPTTPNEDTEAYLSVKVSIAPWTMWSQDVDL